MNCVCVLQGFLNLAYWLLIKIVLYFHMSMERKKFFKLSPIIPSPDSHVNIDNMNK